MHTQFMPHSCFKHIASGSHDVQNASPKITGQSTIVIIVKTIYLEGSSASGALYIFVSFDDTGAADLTRAVYLALDRNSSRSHTLPFSLSGGRMLMLVYDIESDGTLDSGVSYPAVSRELVTSDDTQGMYIHKIYRKTGFTMKTNHRSTF